MSRMDDLDARWRQLSEEVITGMKEWRMQHPKATFTEIESALDERLGRFRARVLEDAALASRAADWSEAEARDRPACPQCGTHLEARGPQSRELVTHHNHTLYLHRRYAVCPKCEMGLFPLDWELQLLPGHLTPALEESLVHLAAWMPFEKAVKELHHFTGVTVSEPTVRRDAQAAGAAYVDVQAKEVERIEQTLPPAPEGPPVQLLSVDGAMVPLVHGAWAEVKTLALGTVQPPVRDAQRGELVVHTTDLSYFSRLADAATFGCLALVETHRRGTETAKQVCAVTDGAEWEQGFVDLPRRDAVRILDFGHAGEYVAAGGQAVLGEGTDAFKEWLKETLHELKRGQPDTVLNTLRDMHTEMSAHGAESEAAAATIQKSVAYLEKRRAHIDYARFQALGYPIGSGSVESANKLVVEARLKGSGMPWVEPHVDPMLALRNIACSDRWEEAWPQITQCLRQQTRAGQVRRHQARQAKQASLTAATSHALAAAPVTANVSMVETVQDAPPSLPVAAQTPLSLPPAVVKKPYRPAANHPWRRSPIGRARYQPSQPAVLSSVGNTKL